MSLTASEERILRKVSRPWWPRATLYCVAIIAVCGGIALSISIWNCVKLLQLAKAGLGRELIDALSNGWLALVIGSTALVAGVFIWSTRVYGLLIRKLAAQTKPPAVR